MSSRLISQNGAANPVSVSKISSERQIRVKAEEPSEPTEQIAGSSSSSNPFKSAKAETRGQDQTHSIEMVKKLKKPKKVKEAEAKPPRKHKPDVLLRGAYSRLGPLLTQLKKRENPGNKDKEYNKRSGRVRSRASLVRMVFGKELWRGDHLSLDSLSAEVEAYWDDNKDRRAKELNDMNTDEARRIMKRWRRLNGDPWKSKHAKKAAAKAKVDEAEADAEVVSEDDSE